MKLFRQDPAKRMQKAYEAKAKEAMEAQRRGDIRALAALNDEAHELLLQVEAIRRQDAARQPTASRVRPTMRVKRPSTTKPR